MTNILDTLNNQILLGDGAIATMLYNKGIFINRNFDEVNLTAPSLVKEIHKDYKSAGADFLTTNTFGANYFRLKSYGLESKVKAINFEGVRLAKEIAQDDVYVAGSIGPLNVTIEPYGMIKEEEAQKAFSEQAKYLEEAGADFLILETFSYLHEALIAVNAIRKVTSLAIVAQMTIGNDGLTIAGEMPDKFAMELDRVGADVIGINCSSGPQGLLEGIEKIIKVTHKPVITQPNAGLPKLVDGRHIYMSTPEYFSSYTRKFIKLGVRVVGGCCGTTPDHIRRMKDSVRSTAPQKAQIEVVNYKEEMPDITLIPPEKKSRFARKIHNKEFVTSVEITPPRGCDPGKVLKSALLLYEKGVDAINIPDGPRASSRMSAMMLAQIIEREVDIETIMHYTCRDRNILGMQSDLLGAYASGLHNILIVTGDPPKMGEYPDATAVFDLDSIGLTQLVNNFNHGLDIIKKPIGDPCGFYIGVGVDPGSVDLDLEIERFHKKVEAGAEFAITQPVFDTKILLHFLDRIKGLDIPIIAGIWPLVSYRNAEFMNNEVPGVNVPDSIMKRMKEAPDKDTARQTGIQIAHETLLELKSLIQGAQVSAPFGRVEYALQVFGYDV